MVIELDDLLVHLLNGNSTGKLVIRRTGPKVYNESRLLHMIKEELIRLGFDVIKKRMYKDNHQIPVDSPYEQYIRDRKGRYAFYWSESWHYACHKDYNAGKLVLTYTDLKDFEGNAYSYREIFGRY